MSPYTVFNILDMVEAIGEEALCEFLSDFSCPQNTEIETFLKHSALDFAQRKISVTHLVINDRGELAAYFTLTHKAVEIESTGLSASIKKNLTRYAQADEVSGNYSLSAFLIAQFAKNSAVLEGDKPEGNSLMDCALNTLEFVQHEIGGGVVYLECEDNTHLLTFYQNEHNHYRQFGERTNTKDGIRYLQLLRFL